MDIQQARKIGATRTIIGASYATIIGYLICAFLSRNLLWLFEIDVSLYIVIGVFLTHIFAFLFGSYAGKLILIESRRSLSIGLLVAWTTLICATFITAIIASIVEGPFSVGNILATIVLMMGWVIVIGSLPTSIIGFYIGRSIRKRGN